MIPMGRHSLSGLCVKDVASERDYGVSLWKGARWVINLLQPVLLSHLFLATKKPVARFGELNLYPVMTSRKEAKLPWAG